MSGVGCGWSTAIVMACSLVAMIIVVSASRARASGVFSAFSPPEPVAIGRLMQLGLPIGLALFVEVAFFSGATLLIGRLGVETVAAHQIAFNIVGVTFIVPLALGMAATIRVGFNVGANNYAGASRSAWVATCTAIVWGVALAATLLIWRHDLVGLYTNETDVVQLAAGLLLLGALFQVDDGPQATVMGTLRGYKDTRAPMVIALVAYWLFGLPVGATLCFGLLGIPGIGVHGVWWGLVVGLAVVATALFARLVRISGDPVRVAQLRLR